MPTYLLYTVDEEGEFDEYIGEREAVNSFAALNMLTPHQDPFGCYRPALLRAAVVQDTLSGEDILQGTA